MTAVVVAVMGLRGGVVVAGEFVCEANAVRLDFMLVMVGEYLGIHWPA
jgi:hypothetical protein